LVVVELLIASGSDANEGVPGIELEGAKSVFTVSVPSSGKVFWSVEVGARAEIGQVLGVVADDGEEPPFDLGDTLGREPVAVENDSAPERFSVPARELAVSKGLDLENLLVDSSFVTKSDVEHFLASSEEFRDYPQTSSLGQDRVVLVGSGAGSLLALEIVSLDTKFRLAGFFGEFSDGIGEIGSMRLGPLDLNELRTAYENGLFDSAVICVFRNKDLRREIQEFLSDNSIPMPRLVHPESFVSSLAVIGPGTIVCSGARVGPGAILQESVFVSGLVNIDHHSSVGTGTTFGPGVFVSGNVNIGEYTTFGTAVGVEPGLVIGDWSVISSGQVITKDVAPGLAVKNRESSSGRTGPG
jgi:serine acetyltransferase